MPALRHNEQRRSFKTHWISLLLLSSPKKDDTSKFATYRYNIYLTWLQICKAHAVTGAVTKDQKRRTRNSIVILYPRIPKCALHGLELREVLLGRWRWSSCPPKSHTDFFLVSVLFPEPPFIVLFSSIRAKLKHFEVKRVMLQEARTVDYPNVSIREREGEGGGALWCP